MKKITFIVQTYHDVLQLEHMLKALRFFYEDSRVVVIGDGDRDEYIAQLSKQYNTELYVGDNFFSIEKGYGYWKRFFLLWAIEQTDWVIKIDTDTGIHRKLSTLPANKCVFGNVQYIAEKNKVWHSIQGGFTGLTKESALEIMNALVYNRISEDWIRGCDQLEALAKEKKRISTDWTLGHIAQELKIPLQEYEEVKCTWKQPATLEETKQYAMTHPYYYAG